MVGAFQTLPYSFQLKHLFGKLLDCRPIFRSLTMIRISVTIAFIFAFVLTTACSLKSLNCVSQSTSEFSPEAIILYEVPIIAQEKYKCGPAAMAMILRYWGFLVTQEDVARTIWLSEAKTTLTTSLELYPAQFGLQAKIITPSLDLIKENISNGVPLIILMPKSKKDSHYVVLVGFDDKRSHVLIHGGLPCRETLHYEIISEQIATEQMWCLKIYP